jgi:hypothetical protein
MARVACDRRRPTSAYAVGMGFRFRRRYTDQQPASRRSAVALLVLFVIGLVVAAMVFFG